MAMTTGLWHGLPLDTYLALDSVHFSALKALEVSPLHYQHALKHEARDTDSMRLGRILHAMVLTADAPLGVAVWKGTRRGLAWKKFKAEHEKETILLLSQLSGAHAMHEAVMRHPEARELLKRGEGEVTVQWETHGLRCRGRIDWLGADGSIVELKTTRSIGSREFAREFAARHYHAQLAFYSDGLAKIGLASPVLPALIVVENAPPHDVCVYRIGYDVIEAGQRKVDAWLRTLADCTRSGRWPGVDGGEERLDMRLPDWAMADSDLEVDVSGIGGGDG